MTAQDLRLLDRPIAFHPCLAQVAGSVTAGLFLSQALYWTHRTSLGGWFYHSADEWTSETSMTRNEQETARRKLRDIGVLEEKLQGVPAVLNFRVNQEKLSELLTGQTSLAKSDKLVCHKVTNLVGEKCQTKGTESTTEIKAESTPIPPFDHSMIVQIHSDFNKLTGLDIPFTMTHRFAWEHWLEKKYTVSDLELVVSHLKRTVKDRAILMNMLRFHWLIQNLETFAEQLAIAKALVRVPKPTPRDRILSADHRTPLDPERTKKAGEVAAKLSTYLKSWREEQQSHG